MQEAPLITKITESQKSQFRQLPFISHVRIQLLRLPKIRRRCFFLSNRLLRKPVLVIGMRKPQIEFDGAVKIVYRCRVCLKSDLYTSIHRHRR